MNLAIIEDHNILRKGIIEIIQNLGNFNFIIEAHNGKDFIEKLGAYKVIPEICIMDIQMPEMG